MNIIAFDTSLTQGSLAVATVRDRQVEVLQEVELPRRQRAAQTLVAAMAELLEAQNWQPQQLDLVCLSVGPGSFTGLRIGATTAKVLAHATGAQLVGVSTLAVIAAGLPKSSRAWTILDAQRHELFVARFANCQWHDLASEPETRLMTRNEWLSELRIGDLVAGPPLQTLAAKIPAGVTVADASLWSPRAAHVAHVGYAACEQGLLVDPMQLVPRYYRRSAAEEKAAADNRTPT